MSYLKFDKEQLINLEYSLHREILRTNKAGTYISTSLNGCNTRKYHGLLVCPIENFGGEKHVLLSSLDVSIVHGKEKLNLGIHRYKGGVYDPKGHKYIRNIEFDQIPVITYRAGGVILTMERILPEKKEQVLIRYTLEKAPEAITLQFRPFLAFRNIHALSKANMFVHTKFPRIDHGISTRIYDGYPQLHMQFSHENEFIQAPDWYYDIEYMKELNRGYAFLEDLFVPGYFELTMQEGNAVVFSAGLEETNPAALHQRFTHELKKRIRRYTFISSLQNASEQFIFHKKKETDIIAGYPWHSSITRQTFIALPGLAMAAKNNSLFEDVLKTYRKYLRKGMFPDHIQSNQPVYQSADAPLWYIWAIQHYSKKNINPSFIWDNFGDSIKEILKIYRTPVHAFITPTAEGLVHTEQENTALTWMDSYVYGHPAVQRAGLAVEINALWFNALCFAIELAKAAGDKEFVAEWKKIPEKVSRAFLKTFWNDGHEHLADVVQKGQADWAIRPNMVIAAGLDYSPLSKHQKKSILSVAQQKLLTKRGLRSLSPDHLRYRGTVKGNPDEREGASHQGAAWPWLMQFFVEPYLRIHQQGGLPFIKNLMDVFEEEMTEHCIGTLSELYDGDPPHKAKGAVSQAWNVAGVYYSLQLIHSYKQKQKK